MAKKTPKNEERRAMVEKLRQEQARKERFRSLAILGACVLVVVGLLAVAGVKYVQDKNAQGKIAGTPIGGIGVPASAAGCNPVVTRKPTGTSVSGTKGSHVDIGTKVNYPDNPPAFGPHWPNYLAADEYRNFYSPADRPELERMVHSLEHGHTLIWYDETIKAGSTAYQDLQAIASKYAGTTTYVNVVPWLSTDGGAFPGSKHVALTHWAGSGNDQLGIWEYCGKVSGAVIKGFVTKYPNTDSPEAGAP